MRTETDIVSRIRRGDRKALLEVFDTSRKPVVTLVTRNGGSADDAEDVLQESVVVFWEKVRNGTFEERSSVGTFIYAIARRIWLQRTRRTIKETPSDVDPDLHGSGDPAPDDLIIGEEDHRLVERALSLLDGTCRSLLVMFYWENLSMETIAQLMGFANAQTAKAKKYQCKERLRRLMQEGRDG